MPTVPYVKQTWTDGVSSASAARLSVIESGIFDAHFQPAVRVTHNTTQSIPTGAITTLSFNTERFDTASNAADTMHDTVTNNSRLTCRYAGKYQITGSVSFAISATGQRSVYVLLNGVTTIAVSQTDAAAGGLNGCWNVTTLYDLAINDYVELQVFQNTGGALLTSQAGNYSPEFMMVRVA